jgi:hypothetical protein
MVSLTDTTRVGFTVTADAGSARANRFRLVFGPGSVVPVTITSIRAYQKRNDIEVEWKVENELNIVSYEVQKSLDGIHFSFANLVAARGGNNTYLSLDVHAMYGDNYYRVKSTDANGQIKYTRIVKVRMGYGSQGITIYPNPASNKQVGIAFANMPEGVYETTIFNNLGQLILSNKINHSAGSSSEAILFNQFVPAGTYHLDIIHPGGKKETLQFVVKQ